MGRIVAVNFVSIDGVMQAPLSAEEDRDGGFTAGGWAAAAGDDTVDAVMRKLTTSAAGMLLGRRTYDIFTEAWSQADAADPSIAAMNRMPKYVVTRNTDRLAWANSRRLGGDLASGVREVRESTEGRLVVFGSGQLVQALAKNDLINEYTLLQYPIVLRSGKRLFGVDRHRTDFILSGSLISPAGVAILTYQRSVNS